MVVSVHGADIFYRTHGTGVPCLMPAILGTAPLAALTPQSLAGHFQFVYVDLRGGGRSTGNASDLTFDLLAEDLDAVRVALGFDRVTVLGYSIAGVLAIEYGRRRPANVSHVIAAGTPPIGDMAAVSAASAQYFAERASEERKRILQENMAALPAGTPPAQAIFAQTPMRFFDARADARAPMAGTEFRPALLERIMALTPRWDVRQDSATLGQPLLVAHGLHDYVVPHTMWDGIVETLPRTTMHVFERSGHQPFYEEPDRFAEVVSRWMRDAG